MRGIRAGTLSSEHSLETQARKPFRGVDITRQKTYRGRSPRPGSVFGCIRNFSRDVGQAVKLAPGTGAVQRIFLHLLASDDFNYLFAHFFSREVFATSRRNGDRQKARRIRLPVPLKGLREYPPE